MQLTRESEYALLGLVTLATSPRGRVTSLAEIAAARRLPATFLAKTFQKLARHGLLVSERGRGSGYALARSPRRITMRQILEAIEGSDVLDRCLLWPKHCGEHDPCPLHYRLKKLRPVMESLLGATTLADYVAQSPHASRGAPRRRRGGLGALRRVPVLAGLLAAGWAGPARAVPPAQSPGPGQTIFQQKCAACHTIGHGTLVGPDLQGVTALRDGAWLARWISGPDQVLASGDPIATGLLKQYNNVPMPNLGLSPSEVESVLAFLRGQGSAPARAATAAAPAEPGATPAAGDARAGAALFTGLVRLTNGAPPCMGCHSIAGIGALGGGALGPDLTAAYTKYGEAGLASILAAPPFPTMRPIFGPRPLTTPEQADLQAYLRDAAVATRPASDAGRLAGLAIAGAALLVGVARLHWRGRLRAVRRPLIARSDRAVPRTPAGKGA